MRAAVLHAPGDIRLESLPVPAPRPDEVLVKVAAVGVCGSDLPRLLTKGAHKMPLVCGHEFSGHIVETGAGVEGFGVGDLVAVPPLIPCRRCPQCLRGQYSRCRDYD
ncbi:MAG: alcohol dehydrogenase catalytic domain-containing protein, partial [Bauldia sp.]|nr:alcohol dehydrogenase catalytic domain-containing protein [Bauldia sp.]